jgi:murein DD-endopeptidase MepM/ murein hydrolase activator NlpD
MIQRFPASKSIPAVPEGRFIWPIESARVNQNFKLDPMDLHLGVDLSGNRRTTIRAAHTGRVVYAGSGFKGYGKMVLIEDQDGWATLYGHLSKIFVKTGQKIVRGNAVGKMGNTGRSTGVHLHYEIRKDKVPYNPVTIMDAQNSTGWLASFF